jgi:peptide/nickel transport system permease protein
MWRYILRRVLIFIPTLLVVTLVSFIIMQSAPGDPVKQMMTEGDQEAGQLSSKKATQRAYLAKREELGLDKPLFYVALATLADPDTLYKIPRPPEREALTRLTFHYGNWPAVEDWYWAVRAFENATYKLPNDSAIADERIELRSRANILRKTGEPADIKRNLAYFDKAIRAHPQALRPIRPAVDSLQAAFRHLRNHPQVWKTYIPVIQFFGTNNQYHDWLAGIFTLDFGKSYKDKRPVGDKLLRAMKWSLILNLTAVFLTYLISIPIGIYSARNRGKLSDNALTALLFVLYSLPNFWVATMLIIFLAGGDFLNIFPASGVESNMHSPAWPLYQRLADWAHHLILPIFCFAYTSFAFMSRQMRVGMLETLTQDFIRTARSKGLQERKVVWKHALRNSLIPIITLFASIFPMMVGGSVILEQIFSIPGMGLMSFEAIMARDYPVIIAVFTLAAILTLVGILVSDILYAVVDPRISYSKK